MNGKLSKYQKYLRRINKPADHMEELSDEELSGLTESFKERLSKGETLEDILPEAFAAIR